MLRYNEDTIGALSSPSRVRVFDKGSDTTFATEREVSPPSRQIWIFGTGNVQVKPVGNDAVVNFTAQNAADANFQVLDIMIDSIGAGSTVDAIWVWD